MRVGPFRRTVPRDWGLGGGGGERWAMPVSMVRGTVSEVGLKVGRPGRSVRVLWALTRRSARGTVLSPGRVWSLPPLLMQSVPVGAALRWWTEALVGWGGLLDARQSAFRF